MTGAANVYGRNHDQGRHAVELTCSMAGCSGTTVAYTDSRVARIARERGAFICHRHTTTT